MRLPVYDAFISYSHAKDRAIAANLQSVIQTLGKPWYRDRALRVFRDDTSLSATPYLWPSIEKALAQSRYLILLASPEAASSPWIAKEVAYWLENKSADTLFIGLTDGELVWDGPEGDFQWSLGPPLPEALKGRFAAEPKWVDLRAYRASKGSRDVKFLELGADFAATIHGIPKEDLLSQEVRQKRRALRQAMSAAVLLLGLALVAVWQWRVAEHETTRAEAETARAEAETLRAEKQRELAETNEARAKRQQKIAEDHAFDARLRAQAAEARVLQATDANAALKRSAETLAENLDSGRRVLPEVLASLFESLQLARQFQVIEADQDVSFGNISSIASTPDSRLIAVGTADLVFIVDRNGRDAAPPIMAPDGYNTLTNQLAWDDKGERLAVASGTMRKGTPANAALRIYDRGGTLIRTVVERHPVPIVSVHFLSEQQILLAGDTVGNIIRADLTTGQTRVIPTGRDGAINGISSTYRGLWLAVGPARDSSGAVKEGSSPAPNPLGDAKALPTAGAGRDDRLRSDLGLSADTHVDFVADSAPIGLFCIASTIGSSYIASCGGDGSVNLWSPPYEGSGVQFGRSLRGHSGPVYAVAWHPKGDILASGGADGDIRLWNDDGTQLGPPLRVGIGINRAVRSLVFIDEGRTLASADNDGRVILWDIGNLQGDQVSGPDFESLDRVIPLAGTRFLAASGGETGWKATLIDLQDKRQRLLHQFPPSESEYPEYDIAFATDPDANRFAWADGNAIRAGTVGGSANTVINRIKSGHATHMAFGHGGRVIAVAGGRKQERFKIADKPKPEPTSLTFIDSATGKTIAVADNPHQEDVVFLAGNPSGLGAAFISVGFEGTARFWSAQGRAIGDPVMLGGENVDIRAAAFSEDGRLAALGWTRGYNDSESYYDIWNTQRVTSLKQPVRLVGKITAIALCPEADVIAVGLSTGAARIHLRYLGGETVGDIPIAQDSSVEALGFSTDGETLFGTLSAGSVWKWQTGAKPLLKLARSRQVLLHRQAEVAALRRAASTALDKKDWNTMAGLLEKARAIDPEDRSVRVLLGNAYRWTKPPQQEKSWAEYDAAIKLNPYYPINYLQRGKLRLATGDYEGAASDFAEGDRYLSYILRGVPLTGDLNQGIHALGFNLQARSGLEFHELRGRAFLGLGKWQEAEAEFTSVIEGTAKLRAAQAYAVEIFKDEPQYAEGYRRALADPIVDRRPEIREQRARARIELKKYASAAADLRSAIDLLNDPKQPYASDDYGGKMDDPAWRARRQGWLHGTLASVHTMQNDSDAAKAERVAAVAALGKAHELAPKNSWILAERAVAKINAGGDRQQALKDYFDAVALEPENAAVSEYLFQMLLWLADYRLAYEVSSAAVAKIKEPPASLRARVAIGKWSIGKHEEARSDWLKLRADYQDLTKELARSSVPLWPIEQTYVSRIEASAE
jgi:WD40 repeat protein